MTTLIKNARIVNEGKVFEGDLLLEGDRIARIDKELSPVDNRVKVLDVGGKWVLPGMIDTQVHFREPGLTHKGTISSESASAVLGGITSYVEQPNTVPQAVTLEELEKKYQRASEVSWANYSFNLGATNANLDELKKASKRTIAGIKIFMGSSTGNMLVDDPQALERIFSEVDHQLIAHCEDEGTIRANLDHYLAEVGEAGLTPSYHPLIRSEEACWKSSSAAVALARKTGARFHVYHLSTGKELQLFDKHLPLEQKKITAEACIHHLWFTDADYATKQNFIKWNPAVKNGSRPCGLACRIAGRFHRRDRHRPRTPHVGGKDGHLFQGSVRRTFGAACGGSRFGTGTQRRVVFGTSGGDDVPPSGNFVWRGGSGLPARGLLRGLGGGGSLPTVDGEQEQRRQFVRLVSV
jgi:dihydroorotase